MTIKKNTWLKWILIISSVAILALICTIVAIKLHKPNTPDDDNSTIEVGEQIAPNSGTWICEELGLKLFYESEESIWNNNGTTIPCIVHHNKFSPYVSVFEIDEKIPMDGFDHPVYAYAPGERLFAFTVKSFTDDSMVVSDENGNVYTFYRDDIPGSDEMLSNAEDFYAEVLQDYKTIVDLRLSDNFESDWNKDHFPVISLALIAAIQDNPNAEWSTAVVEMTAGLEAPAISSFGYILRDINDDDFPELFLVREDGMILAVFTNRNDRLVLLDVFWSEHQCVITEKDALYIRTSSGAAYTDYSIQALTPQETLLKTQQFGLDGISEENEQQYFEIVYDVKQVISEEQFNKLLSKNPFEFGEDWLSQVPTFLA